MSRDREAATGLVQTSRQSDDECSVTAQCFELAFIELERQTGVLRQSLMKFARSEQSLRLDQADKLASYFGLELTQRKEAD